jgi:hypothetical protein
MRPLVCAVVQRGGRGVKTFLCPLFRSVPAEGLCLDADMVRIDGELENFVWYVPIRAQATDRQLICEGAALVCHLPDIFV